MLSKRSISIVEDIGAYGRDLPCLVLLIVAREGIAQRGKVGERVRRAHRSSSIASRPGFKERDTLLESRDGVLLLDDCLASGVALLLRLE